jgi:hypothetical protein
MIKIFINNKDTMQVSDYMNQFRNAINAYLPTEEPGRVTRLNLIGEYIARDKREIVLYIAHGSPDTATVVTRIIYRLPVPMDISQLFVRERVVIPSNGPHFKTFDCAGQSAQHFVETNIGRIAGLADWFSEDQRIRALAQAEAAGVRKSTLNNMLIYWRNMRARVYDALYLANVRLPRTSSGTVRSRTRSRRLSTHSTNASNVKNLHSSSGSRRSNYTRSARSSKSSPRPNSLSNHNSDPKP